MRRVSYVLAACVLGVALSAQAPLPGSAVPTTAPAPAKPQLSDLETAWVQIAALSQQLAQCQSQQLDSVKQFANIRSDVITRIEKAHPGYTVDWLTGALTVKAAAK